MARRRKLAFPGIRSLKSCERKQASKRSQPLTVANTGSCGMFGVLVLVSDGRARFLTGEVPPRRKNPRKADVLVLEGGGPSRECNVCDSEARKDANSANALTQLTRACSLLRHPGNKPPAPVPSVPVRELQSLTLRSTKLSASLRGPMVAEAFSSQTVCGLLARGRPLVSAALQNTRAISPRQRAYQPGRDAALGRRPRSPPIRRQRRAWCTGRQKARDPHNPQLTPPTRRPTQHALGLRAPPTAEPVQRTSAARPRLRKRSTLPFSAAGEGRGATETRGRKGGREGGGRGPKERGGPSRESEKEARWGVRCWKGL